MTRKREGREMELDDGKYESGHRKQWQPPKNVQMNHTSQGALFSPSVEKTQTPEECLFCLTITPSARCLVKLSQVHLRRHTPPESWENGSPLTLLTGCSFSVVLSEIILKKIFSAHTHTHSMVHVWMGNLTTWSQPGPQPARMAWKKRAEPGILMSRQSDMKRPFLVNSLANVSTPKWHGTAEKSAQIPLWGFNYTTAY